MPLAMGAVMARVGRRQREHAGSAARIGIAATCAGRSGRPFGPAALVATCFLIAAGAAGFAQAAGAAVESMALEVDSPSAATARWRVLDELPSRGETLSAFAEAEGAGLAVGDAAGVSWWHDGHWSRAQTPPVRDLAFDRDGRLWIGSEEGLQFWARDARPQRRPLRDGETSNRVSRIEASRGALVVATEGGAYWSSSGAVFQPLGSGSADQSVAWVAVRRAAPAQAGEPAAGRPGPGLTEVWSFGGEGLVRTRGIEASLGLRVIDRVLWPLPRPAAEAGVVDLVFDREETRLHVVYRDAIAVLTVEGSDPRDLHWQWIRPVLSPGAAIQRLVFGAAGDVWLATDHGLLTAEALTARFARTANPAGSRACSDVVEASDLPGRARALALCRTSLLALVGDEQAPVVAAEPPEIAEPALAGGEGPGGADGRMDSAGEVGLAADPPVAEIRSRALARVGLSVERADGLWRGLRKKALWPSLQLRGAYDADEDRGLSRNQSFVSGDTRNLLDRDRGEGTHYAAVVTFDWELGGLAYPDDSVDLSRELRQVTSLRDDVADEIHQLYFERQRIRARLTKPELLAPEEITELVLRAEELDSGLDAWTGGWLGAWRAANAASAPHSIHPGRSDRSVD